MSAIEPNDGSTNVSTLPTISSYYADPKIKPISFAKAVRAAKIMVFQLEDLELARTTLPERDSELSRTLSLGLVSKQPEAIERWVIETTRSSVQKIYPDALSEEGASGELVFDRIVRALSADLRSKNKLVRRRAENLARLTLIWLISRRSLDPLPALHALAVIGNGKPGAKTKSVRADGQKLLVRTKLSQWRNLLTVAKLGTEAVIQAEQARDDAIKTRERLEARLAEIDRELAAERQRIEAFAKDVGRLESELAASRHETETERQLRELDVAESVGRTRSLLIGRLSLLLADARDALDFEPPHVEAARQRIDAAKETIARELSKPNG